MLICSIIIYRSLTGDFLGPIYTQYEYNRNEKMALNGFNGVGVKPIILEYTRDVAEETAGLYERVAHVIPEIEWPAFAPYVKAINDLKKERGAIILAHNYMTPEIYNCVADITGDSLQLAKQAAQADAEIIVQAGVNFMAETAKILSPEKTILIPDSRAGCSLAESITAHDVRQLKQQYPGVPVVTYVNTYSLLGISDMEC